MTVRTCRHCGAVSFVWLDEAKPSAGIWMLGGSICGCPGIEREIKFKKNYDVRDTVLVVMKEEPE